MLLLFFFLSGSLIFVLLLLAGRKIIQSDATHIMRHSITLSAGVRENEKETFVSS